MKQLVILSGKGGTGKTSLAAAFAHLAHLAQLRTVLADADVDAANLELVLHPQKLEQQDFMGGAVARIDPELCEGCGTCQEVCRFEAVLSPNGSPAYKIDPIACEGCAACRYACPSQAIRMEPQLAGRWFRSQTSFGPLFHAELRPAQENSGKLVTLVRQLARLQALDQAAELIIIDGPPGIGCPVISAASGADMALIVTEPSAAGIHDMERVLDLTAHFRLPTLVCINKWDIHPQGSEHIRTRCTQQGIPITDAGIPFDETINAAMVHGQPITEFDPKAPASLAFRRIWEVVLQILSLRPEMEKQENRQGTQ